MLHLNPDAAGIVDSEGSLPLHLCLESGKSWFSGGVKELFLAAPSASLRTDKHHRSALMIATEKCDLTSIFEILRANPCVLQNLHN